VLGGDDAILPLVKESQRCGDRWDDAMLQEVKARAVEEGMAAANDAEAPVECPPRSRSELH